MLVTSNLVMERIKILCFVLLFVSVSAKPRQKLSPPIIKNVSEGNELVVNAQNNITLLCEGKENITWAYPNNTIEERYWSSVVIQTSEANGKYSAKLTLVNASYVDVDYYYCHAEGAAKDDEERSAKVYLYVRDILTLATEVVPPIVTPAKEDTNKGRKNTYTSLGTANERDLVARLERNELLTQHESELHQLRVEEQKIKILIAKEQLFQEELRTKIIKKQFDDII